MVGNVWYHGAFSRIERVSLSVDLELLVQQLAPGHLIVPCESEELFKDALGRCKGRVVPEVHGVKDIWEAMEEVFPEAQGLFGGKKKLLQESSVEMKDVNKANKGGR